VRKYLQIHNSWQAGSNGGESRATILVGHENALRVPIVPVHHSFENGNGKRMQRLTRSLQNFLHILAVKVSGCDVVVLGVDPIDPFRKEVDRHAVGPLNQRRSDQLFM
jgi:hypothetical protein